MNKLFLSTIIAFVTACAAQNEQPNDRVASDVARFETYDEAVSYFQDHASLELGAETAYSGGVCDTFDDCVMCADNIDGEACCLSMVCEDGFVWFGCGMCPAQ